MPKALENATVLDHRVIGPLVRRLTVKSPAISKATLPGQFVHLKVADGIDPLLRRPISIATANPASGTLDLIYRVVGRGTAAMTKLSYNDTLSMMGPLGNGFLLTAKRPLLVGGGMGLAPLVFLAQTLCPRPVTLLMGGRNKDEMYWQTIFADICRNIHITTDDGSLGQQGFTVDALPTLLSGGDFDMIYACGPRPMLQGVAVLAKTHNIPCQISLEDHMACGVGACLSCTCAGTDGKRRKVCSDGPVFNSEEVLDLC